jgi:hypothetical protein
MIRRKALISTSLCDSKASQRLTIEAMQQIAVARGGRCLSGAYVNVTTPLLWQCANGHRWDETPAYVKSGSWCKACVASVWLNKVQEMAKERGGRCLSDTYVNSRTPMLWECANKHQWHASQNRTALGQWCRLCVSDKELETMRRIASEHGGLCLSNSYVNTESPLQWECARGHRWHARPHGIKTGKWCRQCRDDNMRGSLERMQELALHHGGQVLSKSYVDNNTKLRWKCAQGHTWESLPRTVASGSWCRKCYFERRRCTLEDVQQLASKKGGFCLSTTYIDGNTDLTWQCGRGHTWQAPSSRIHSRWCPVCNHDSKRLGLSKMQELAAVHGGRCLSVTYKNVNTPLTWQCIEGHIWENRPCNVQSGSWCPECRRIALDQRKKQDTTKKKERFSLRNLL